MDVPLSSNTSLALNVMFALDVVTSGIDLTNTVNSQLRICICSNKQELQKEKVYFFHKNKTFLLNIAKIQINIVIRLDFPVFLGIFKNCGIYTFPQCIRYSFLTYEVNSIAGSSVVFPFFLLRYSIDNPSIIHR